MPRHRLYSGTFLQNPRIKIDNVNIDSIDFGRVADGSSALISAGAGKVGPS